MSFTAARTAGFLIKSLLVQGIYFYKEESLMSFIVNLYYNFAHFVMAGKYLGQFRSNGLFLVTMAKVMTTWMSASESESDHGGEATEQNMHKSESDHNGSIKWLF